MAKTSAGLLVYRFTPEPHDALDALEVLEVLEVLVVHPGGPFWAKKDEGAWSIPKGEYGPGDDPAACAKREFFEELGVAPPEGTWADLGEVTQGGGKRVHAWAVRGDLDVTEITSNTFEIEWPPRSGRVSSFPEVDAAAWVSAEEARRKLVSAQSAIVDRLVDLLEGER